MQVPSSGSRQFASALFSMSGYLLFLASVGTWTVFMPGFARLDWLGGGACYVPLLGAMAVIVGVCSAFLYARSHGRRDLVTLVLSGVSFVQLLLQFILIVDRVE